MTGGNLVDPPPPVSFDDTVATLPPLECHVLFEWPLSQKLQTKT